MLNDFDADSAKLKEKAKVIEEEQKKVEQASDIFKKSGGMMEPISPDSWEAWRAAFAEITGINIGIWTIIGFGVLLYSAVVVFGLHTKVANIFVPLISSEGRRMLQERGQYAISP